MRVLSIGFAALCIAVLLGVVVNEPSPPLVVLSLMLIVVATALVLVPGVIAQIVLVTLTMSAAALASYLFGVHGLWFGTFGASLLALLAMIFVTCAWLFAWSNTHLIYPDIVMLKINNLLGGLQIYPGPARLLHHPFATPLALLPRGRQEFQLTLHNVDTMPYDTPFGPADQKIKQLVVEIVYQLQLSRYERIFLLPNKNERFRVAAETLNVSLPRVMLNPEFWTLIWRDALSEAAERIVRDRIHCSALSPLAVDKARSQLARQMRAELVSEVDAFGLTIRELSLLQVEPDISAATLREREAHLQALNRAEELHVTSNALSTIIGQLRAANNNRLSDELLETLILGSFPNPMHTSRIQHKHHGQIPNTVEVAFSAPHHSSTR
jgi:hypothetical protein